MNHTPGPWGWQFFGPHLALVGKHSDRPIILDVTPKGVMRLRDGHIMRPITMVAECDESPDLRLLTAAPELLEACKSTLRLLRENGHTHDAPKQAADYDILDQFDTGLSSPISAVLEAAIAKAEGRTQ